MSPWLCHTLEELELCSLCNEKHVGVFMTAMGNVSLSCIDVVNLGGVPYRKALKEIINGKVLDGTG